MKKLGLALIATALLSFSLGSCALATGTQNAATAPSASDLKSLQSSYMTSYYADRSGSPDGISSIRALTPFSAAATSASRATAPMGTTTSYSFASLQSAAQTVLNYPEPGQISTFSAALVDTNYLITVTTSYPSTDTRESYVEKYYVHDGVDPGNWTSADIIVDTSSSTTKNDAARQSMTLIYRDGSQRSEMIQAIYPYDASYSTDKIQFGVLDIGGTLDISQVTAAPAIQTSQAGVTFSSVVVYTYQPARDSSSFWFWKGKKGAGIIGARYYSEYADSTNQRYIGRSASFEKIVGNFGNYSVADATTRGVIIAAIYNAGLSSVLGGSVVRQEVRFALNGDGNGPSGSATSSWTRMQTRIMDFVNSWDYILIQDGSDTVSLGSPIPW